MNTPGKIFSGTQAWISNRIASFATSASVRIAWASISFARFASHNRIKGESHLITGFPIIHIASESIRLWIDVKWSSMRCASICGFVEKSIVVSADCADDRTWNCSKNDLIAMAVAGIEPTENIVHYAWTKNARSVILLNWFDIRNVYFDDDHSAATFLRLRFEIWSYDLCSRDADLWTNIQGFRLRLKQFGYKL